MRQLKFLLALLVVAGVFWVLDAKTASAHCDTVNGPVAQSAARAFGNNNVSYALVWVKKDDEDEVRQAFQKAQKDKTQNPADKEKAETEFLETLVRVHRAGEGAKYTGLKPEGSGISPAIAAADKAVESGSLAELNQILQKAISQGLEKSFNALMEQKNYPVDDIEAGRKYIKAYVDFVHYAKHLETAATRSPADGH